MTMLTIGTVQQLTIVSGREAESGWLDSSTHLDIGHQGDTILNVADWPLHCHSNST